MAESTDLQMPVGVTESPILSVTDVASSRPIAAPGSSIAYREARAAAASECTTLEDLGESGRAFDGARWRKRLGLTPHARVFVCSVIYPDWRDALLARGWKQNPDFYSPHFNMKIALKTHQVGHGTLTSGQAANHYSGAGALCTKHGLVRLLREVRAFAPARAESFFPRAYDLADSDDFSAFLDEHRYVTAEGIIRRVVHAVLDAAVQAGAVRAELLLPPRADGMPPSPPCLPTLSGSSVPYERALYLPSSLLHTVLGSIGALTTFARGSGEHGGAAPKWNVGVLKVALDVTARRCPQWTDAELDIELDSGGDGEGETAPREMVSTKEWEVLRWCDVTAIGGPVEQAPILRAREERERDEEASENVKKDKLIKRLMRQDPAAAAAALSDISSLANAMRRAEDAAAGSGIEENEEVEDADQPDKDDDGESSSESDTDAGVGGTGPRTGKGGLDACGTTSGLDPARLRAWRARLSRDRNGAQLPSTGGGDVAGEAPVTLSSSSPSCANMRVLSNLDEALWSSLLAALGRLNDSGVGEAGAGCQAALNACPPRNVWIVKPAGKSRGRGIECETDLARILNRRGGAGHRETHWIVQKYIERPLLVAGRKWDIRQWVLVTSWAPLTVWFYSDCYLRFCAYPFTLDNLGNRFIHLSNNSVQKHSGAFDAAAGTVGEGNMWHVDKFSRWLQEQSLSGSWDGLQYVPDGARGYGAGWDVEEKGQYKGAAREEEGEGERRPVSSCPAIWEQVLQPSLRRIVTWSLCSAQEAMAPAPGPASGPQQSVPTGRNGAGAHAGSGAPHATPPLDASDPSATATLPYPAHTWELFGYDFMVDADLRPWLIEINSSPDFSYSTPVTEGLVKAASEDTMKVVVDYAGWAAGREASRKERRGKGAQAGGEDADAWAQFDGPPPGTGGWQLIYKAPAAAVSGAPMTCALQGLSLTGKGYGGQRKGGVGGKKGDAWMPLKMKTAGFAALAPARPGRSPSLPPPTSTPPLSARARSTTPSRQEEGGAIEGALGGAVGGGGARAVRAFKQAARAVPMPTGAAGGKMQPGVARQTMATSTVSLSFPGLP